MTKEKAKYAVEVMQAYIDGKEIEYFSIEQNEWCSVDVPIFDWSIFNYRIKQEAKYRPFKNKEECWNEIQKHSPFGWVKTKHNTYGLISYIRKLNNIDEVMINVAHYDFKEAFDVFTFIDGTPFGIKEE